MLKPTVDPVVQVAPVGVGRRAEEDHQRHYDHQDGIHNEKQPVQHERHLSPLAHVSLLLLLARHAAGGVSEQPVDVLEESLTVCTPRAHGRHVSPAHVPMVVVLGVHLATAEKGVQYLGFFAVLLRLGALK